MVPCRATRANLWQRRAVQLVAMRGAGNIASGDTGFPLIKRAMSAAAAGHPFRLESYP